MSKKDKHIELLKAVITADNQCIRELKDSLFYKAERIVELESEIRRLKHKPATGFGLTLTRRDRLNNNQ